MNRIRSIILAIASAALVASAADEAAIIAALTGARTMKPTGEGFQLVTQNGQWMRAVKTLDGGYSIFSTNGSSRMFPTPMGFGYLGPSNDNRAVTRSARGFTITGGPVGTISMTKAGSAWLMQGATNNERIIANSEGWSSVSGPLAPMPADTVYELFRQREALNPEPGFVQPPPAPLAQPPPIKIRTNLDR